jgi:hypothetical protein
MFTKMLKRNLYILALTIFLFGNLSLLTSCKEADLSSNKQIISNNEAILEPVYSVKSKKGFYAEINPNIELLSGALSQTSWIKVNGPRGDGNAYFQELKNYFTNFKDEKAIQLLQNLTNEGFTYDAPPNFILSLGALPNLKVEGDYSDYLKNRAGSRKKLEDLRLALVKLNKVSNFTDFFQAHHSEYEKLLEDTLYDFDSDKIITWLNNYYGWKADEFHLVLAPAMFPGGGYGATIKKLDGSAVSYQIIRASGKSSLDLDFPKAKELDLLALHEWGHSYVNPTLEANNNLVKRYNLKKLFEPVKDEMKAQAYSNVETFLNEQVLRATTAMAIKALYGNDAFKQEIEYNNSRYFYLTEFTTTQLEVYDKNRDKYKTFKDFAPYLLDQYNKNMDDLLKKAK